MNNKDRALAEKAISARMIKMERERPGSSAMLFSPTRLSSMSRASISGNTSKSQRPGTSSQLILSPVKPPNSPMPYFEDTSGSSVAEEAPSSNSNTMSSIQGGGGHGSLQIDELAARSLTKTGDLRKLAMKAQKKMANASKQGKGTFKFDDAHFIPKTPIRRPDGATLSDVYKSKKQDLWGKIIKQQYLESEDNKILNQMKKAKANEDFGKLLTAQLSDNDKRRHANDGSDTKLLAEVEALSKKNDDVQKKRVQDAKDRHVTFIQNALEDIETKRVQRLKNLDEEMFGSSMLIEKTKFLIAQDEEKKERFKVEAAKMQERLYAENLASIEKRRQDKLNDWDLVAKIQRESDANWDKEQARRKRELAHLVGRSADGPAHGLYRKLITKAKDNEDEMFKMFLSKENGLSRQLKASEDAFNYRVAQLKGDGTISKSWSTMMKRQAKEREEERLKGIYYGNHAKKMDQEHIVNEAEKRAKRTEAAATYQKDLDQQLNALRSKSLGSLEKTMSDVELDMNMSLIRKYGIQK